MIALPPGFVVGGYRLGVRRGEWGFHLAYDAEEIATGRKVVVHELVPEELVTRSADGALAGRDAAAAENFKWARERFLAEGRALAACVHPGLEKIVAVLETHGTACRVTPEETGRSVKQWLAALGRAPTEAEWRAVLEPALDALAAAHAAGLLHLNLKPETIRLEAGGQPVLTHFAGARQAIARHSHDAGVATAGYSAPEQYDAAATESAATDIYALAAVGCRAITGEAPPAAPSRQPREAYRKLAGRFPAYGDWLLRALDAALAVDTGARPATVVEWRKMLAPTPLERLQARVRRDPLASIGGALAVILAVFLLGRVFFPKPETPKPASPAKPTPAGSASGAVGSALDGVWETAAKNSTGQPLLRLTIWPGGLYELTGARQDRGATFAKLGVLNMNSTTTRRAMKSTFKYLTMQRMMTDGDLGKHEWTRVAAAPLPPETPAPKK